MFAGKLANTVWQGRTSNVWDIFRVRFLQIARSMTGNRLLY